MMTTRQTQSFDEYTTAASLVMEMAVEVLFDGTAGECPGCAGHVSAHDGEEALAA